MSRLIATIVAASMVLSACDRGEDPTVDPTPAAPSRTTAPGAPSPAATSVDITTTPPPDEITVEWADAVINELLATYGELAAAVLAEPVQPAPVLPDGTAETLVSIFRGQYLERRRVEIETYAVDLDGIRAELLPADRFTGLRFETSEILFAEPTCVIAAGHITRAGTLITGGRETVLSAVSLAPGTETTTSNPTEWVIVDELLNTDASGAENPDEILLSASLQDFGDSLQHTCSS